MLIVDDILLAPFSGLLWVFRKVHEAVEQEVAGEAERLTFQLSELYMLLETGKISEEEFDAAERELLDRLDQVEAFGEATDEGTEGTEPATHGGAPG